MCRAQAVQLKIGEIIVKGTSIFDGFRGNGIAGSAQGASATVS
jgi:hypothetical protein